MTKPRSGQSSRWSRSRAGAGHARGVSDMVATILIVAITVVLAAVLIFMVSGLTHTTTSALLGSDFAWAPPLNDTGTNTFGCAATTHYCYLIPVAFAGGDLRLSSMSLSLQTPAGVTVAWPTSISAPGGTLKLISPTSATVVANYWVTNSTWQVVPPSGGAVASADSVVIYCGGAAEGAGQGLSGVQLVAVGANGYSGTVPSGTIT